jgi:hypothetical protein
MSEIMMAFDIRIPQERLGFGEHRIDAERGQFDGRDAAWFEDRLFDVRIGAVGDRLGIARWGQGDQPIGLHAIEL